MFLLEDKLSVGAKLSMLFHMENTLNLEIKEATSAHLQLVFSGRFSLDTVADYWQQCVDLLAKHHPAQLTLDVTHVDYCDGSGMGLLLELRARQLAENNKCNIVGLSKQQERLMRVIVEQPHREPYLEEASPSVAVTIGQYTMHVLHNLRDDVIYVGMISYQLLRAILRPSGIRWSDLWKTVGDVGPNALPIVALIGFLIGVIASFQAAEPMGRFGAQIYLINLVGLGLFREMGPLMTAVLLAGRTASSFAAELGTMKINQEIDALTTMGLDPIKFLVIPRIIATTLMTPFLNMFFIFFGIVGSMLVMNSLGYNFDIFMNQLHSAVSLGDFIGGMVKAFGFGFVVAGVGCVYGLKTRFGASAVGYSTTQAVVTSLIMIVLVDGLFASVYYVLGI